MQKKLPKDNSIDRSLIMTASIMVLLFIGTLNSITSGVARMGKGSLLVLLSTSFLALCGSYIKLKEIPKYNWMIARWGIVHLGISLINLFSNFSIRGVQNIIQFFLCLSFVLFISNLKWGKSEFRLLGKMASCYIFFNFAYWLISGRKIPFSSIYSNSNFLGSFIVFVLFFVLLGRHYSRKKGLYNIGAILGMALIFFSDTRSAVLVCLASVIIFLLWKSIIKNEKRFNIFFWSLITALIAFIIIYPKLDMWPQFHVVSNFVYKYTGKNLFSGRNEIWSALIDLVNSKPMLGLGPGVIPSEVTSIQASSHNLFLQIALQNGYIGLMTFILFLLSFWKRFWRFQSSYHTRLAASFFVGIMIHQSFEVALTQNQLSVGLIQWLIIGIGISRTNKEFLFNSADGDQID